MTYQPNVYREQGGDILVIRAVDGGVVKGQSSAGGTPAQAAASVNLTDSTTGTADATVADVGATFNQATLNNNFADVTAKLNDCLAALRNTGLIAQ